MSEEDLRRLIERTHELLGSRVTVGSLPEHASIPRPAGARVLGSVVRGPEEDPDQATAYLDVPGSADAIRSSFDELFLDIGFARKEPAGFPGQGGGFVHSLRPFGPGPVLGGTYCSGEDGPYYSVAIGEGDPAPVSVSWHSGVGGWHPCAPQPHRPMGLAEDIPSLSNPPGVMVEGGGGGGSEGSWYGQGIALTDMPPSRLLDHYAAELETGGCERLARADTETASWGRWKMPKKDLETILAVVAGHPSMRLLLRYTFSQRDQKRRLHMMTSGWRTFRFG